MTWTAEIEGLHDFFAAWFSGSTEAGDLSRFSDALESDFTIVGPDGVQHDAGADNGDDRGHDDHDRGHDDHDRSDDIHSGG